MNYWGIFLTSTGGTTGILVLAFFIVKKWLSSKIEKDVQYQYDVKLLDIKKENIQALEKIKTENTHSLEAFKAGYQKVLDENQIRFSKWHDARADVIKEMYSKLTKLQNALQGMVKLFKFVLDGIDPDEHAKKENQKFNEALIESFSYFEDNKILFTESHILALNLFHDDVCKSNFYHGMSINIRNANGEASLQLADRANEISKSLETILDDLRKEFRAILNGEEVQDAE